MSDGRRLAMALAAAAAFSVIAGVVVDFAGIAGYRGGFLLATAALAVGPLLLLARFGRDIAGRGILAAAFLILAVTGAAVVHDRAPESHGELARRLDGLDLPLFEQVSESRLGSSTCRPSCPAIERRYDAPSTAPFAAVSRVSLELLRRGMITVDDRPRNLRSADFTATTTDGLHFHVRARAKESPEGPVRVTIRLTAN